MAEIVFPPSPSWFLPKILASREDGSVAYGSKNDVVILKPMSNNSLDTLIISNAHEQRITSVVFSPLTCNETLQNTVASCAEDGLVKLWRIDTLTAFIGHKSHWEQKESLGKTICLDWSQANSQYIVSAADNNSLVQWDTLSNTTIKFSFYKLAATTIACCPHNEKVVAVGVKSGLVFIINLTGTGDIIYKLRGHDNEIQLLSWCPVPYNILRQDEIYEEFLLASTCQDKEIYIWRAGSDGKCEIKIQVPTSSISKKDGDSYRTKLGNSFSFTALLWHDAYRIYLSSNFGELLFFDIESYLSKAPKTPEVKANKQSLIFFKLGHHIHSKGLFAIAGISPQQDILLLDDIEIKSNLKFRANGKCKIIKQITSDNIEKNKWMVNICASLSLLWTAGQDRKLIACKVEKSKLDIIFNLHTLNGSVYSTAVSPHDPNKIAFGSGDGIIRLWNLLQPPGEVQMYWQKIKDRVMSLAWHPTKDGILAYGTSEGRVGVIETNTNKMPNVFKPSQPYPIYSLSWGPQLPGNNGGLGKKEFNLYSVGNNILSCYNMSNIGADPINLTKLLPFQCKRQTDVSWKPDCSLMAVGCDDGTIYLVEPIDFKIVHTLAAYKKMVQSIAWHPSSTSVDLGLSPYHTFFTSGSTENENEIRVFNYLKEDVNVEQVASLKGHYGHIQSVCWSTHTNCRLASTSSDWSVQIWDVITQTPLVNYKPITLPVLSIWSPIDSDIILTGCRNGVFCGWKISAQTKTLPSSVSKSKKQKRNKGHQMSVAKDSTQVSVETLVNLKDNIPSAVTMAEVKTTIKNSKEIKMFSKAWRDNVGDEFTTCYSLLKGEASANKFSLSFLRNDDSYLDIISVEEDVHKTSNNWTEYYELLLWNGKIKNVIEEKMKTGQLNDFLISLAPTISTKLWQDACLSYSKSLVEKRLYRKAASYLLCCHKIYEAITLLKDENLYLEALCLAKSRLPKSDPIIQEIIQQYANWLFKNGSFLKACECFIYLNDYTEVAKICGKKSQPEYLSLAALAARKIDAKELESQEATKAVFKCFKSNNLEFARRICDDHSNLKHLLLLYHMYETILRLDAGEIGLEKDILSHVKDLMEISNIDYPPGLPHLYQQQTFYKNKQEMFIVVSQELSLACTGDHSNMLTHLVKALSTCYRYIQISENEIDPLYNLCNWLSPTGLLSEKSYFTLKDPPSQPKVKSLREFVGAAIVRNLNINVTVDTVLLWISILDELKDSFLSPDSFRYYKNLIDVEICEKRLMTDQNVLTRYKLSTTKVEGVTCEVTENGHQGSEIEICQMGRSGDVNGLNNFEPSATKIEFTAQCTNENSQGAGSKNGAVKPNKKSEGKLEEDGFVAMEEKIKQDKDLLVKLRCELEHFETTRISSPNPVPIFFLLKKICMSVPESEIAENLLRALNRKWMELN